MHNDLMRLTQSAPMKQIDVNGEPYLQRYYMGDTADGDQIWLHRFISGDGDRHLHNHPFEADSYVLTGWYNEETKDRTRKRRPCGATVADVELLINQYNPRDLLEFYESETITPFTWHRIVDTKPNTWTLMIVKPGRLPFWYFAEEENYVTMQSAPENWHKSRSFRGYGVDVL